VNIREIASTSAGDENLLAQSVGVFEHGNVATVLARLDRAHQSRRPAAENQCVE